MKLVKEPDEPKTELDYWLAIESLGEIAYSTRRLIARGDIEDSDGSSTNDVEDALTAQARFVDQIVEKFGVILPTCHRPSEQEIDDMEAPEGQVHYWAWYRRQEREWSLSVYSPLLCSVCPFSRGLEVFIPQHRVHCDFDPSNPGEWKAHHVNFCPTSMHSDDFDGDKITLHDIYARILAEHGQDTLDAFQAKEAEIGAECKGYTPGLVS
jgi:hypothetical protein